MNEQQLKEYKNTYNEIVLPHHIVKKNWEAVHGILPEQEKSFSYYRFMPYGAAFAAFILVLLVTVSFAQVAKPGTPLYPVKAITKSISTKLTNTFQIHPLVSEKVHKAAVITVAPTETQEATSNASLTGTQQKENSDKNEEHNSSLPTKSVNKLDIKDLNEATPSSAVQTKKNDFESTSPAEKVINTTDVKGASTKNFNAEAEKNTHSNMSNTSAPGDITNINHSKDK